MIESLCLEYNSTIIIYSINTKYYFMNTIINNYVHYLLLPVFYLFQIIMYNVIKYTIVTI